VRALILLNSLFLWAEAGLLLSFLKLLPAQVPLLYTQPWGTSQLVPAAVLWLLPLTSLLLLAMGLFFSEALWREREPTLALSVLMVTSISELFIFMALVRILRLTLPTFSFNLSAKLYLAASIAFLSTVLVSPLVIGLARSWGIIDDPQRHKHPAILHTYPVPRAGALAFFVGFMGTALMFLPLTKHLLGIYLGAFIAIILGALDDKLDLNPYLRLALEALAAGIVVASGVGITFFSNPFGGIIRLDSINIPIHFWGTHHLLLVADIFALLWMLWVMNLLSWSNGVDGQFSGIVFITCLVLSLLSLRLVPYNALQGQTAVLAAICGGAALGLLPQTFHPAKVFWGFGAIAPGLIVASLAILSGAKVATATLVLLVPVLDALVTIARRILRGRSPVWGDREHFHHQLLVRGFSQSQVALIYWILTAFLGTLALVTAGRSKALALISLGGIIGFILILLNLGFLEHLGRIRLWGRGSEEIGQSGDDE